MGHYSFHPDHENKVEDILPQAAASRQRATQQPLFEITIFNFQFEDISTPLEVMQSPSLILNQIDIVMSLRVILKHPFAVQQEFQKGLLVIQVPFEVSNNGSGQWVFRQSTGRPPYTPVYGPPWVKMERQSLGCVSVETLLGEGITGGHGTASRGATVVCTGQSPRLTSQYIRTRDLRATIQSHDVLTTVVAIFQTTAFNWSCLFTRRKTAWYHGLISINCLLTHCHW